MTQPVQGAVPRLGIVGAGQLARMTYAAAIPLGLTLRLLAARADDSAALVGADVLIGAADSAEALASLVAGCDVTTFDHELVDGDALAALEQTGHCVRPSPAVVKLVQNKRLQRERLSALGFPVPQHQVVSSADDLRAFGAMHGWPIVAKAVRGGYDGRGVWIVDGPGASDALVAELSGRGVELLAEAWVQIEREVAVLIARRPSGDARSYPLVETVQRDGICHELLCPAPVAEETARDACRLGLAIAEAFGVVGILAVELFVTDDGLVVNELAARPHNSGHFTIEGCVTSQFENHVRAVLDLPLGETGLVAPAVATVNVLGGPRSLDPRVALANALAVEGAHVHLYGKGARPGRKLGHVTVVGTSMDDALHRARRASRELSGPVM